MAEIKPISSNHALLALIRQLEEAEFVTVDTEFVRTSTYFSKLCLIQVASGNGSCDEVAVAIDPLAPGLNLRPFYDFLSDSKPVKVFHAARQDFEIFYHAVGKLPKPFFDTQVAAMVCGFGDSVGYDKLVKQITGANIDKTMRFTDWSRRPVTQTQLSYALSDVTHLREVYVHLRERLSSSGRSDWLAEELSVLTSTSTYKVKPEECWRRFKSKSRNRRYLGRLRALAAWREEDAVKRDQPRGRIARDEVLSELAAHPPESLKQLMKVRGISEGLAKSRWGHKVMEALARAEALAEDDLPHPPEDIRSSKRENSTLLDLLRVLLKYKSRDAKVAVKLVASAADLEAFASGQTRNLHFLEGWRHEIFGEDALALRDGKLRFSLDGESLLLERL